MRDPHLMLRYPHLALEENRRELEREQKLRREIRNARLEARQRAKSSRTSLLSRLHRATPAKPRTRSTLHPGRLMERWREET